MAIEYLGLSEINGPLVVLEGVENASFEEIVEITAAGGEKKLGRIVELYEDKAVIQVFEGNEGLSLQNTRTRLTGHPMEAPLSPEILGRTFDGIGRPIDGCGAITPEVRVNINGLPLNPVAREYPRNYIRTGISAIDGLTTLIRGQKLPIFSGNGLPRSSVRPPWEGRATRNSPSCSRPWASNMTWLISSAGHLKRAVCPTTWSCT